MSETPFTDKNKLEESLKQIALFKGIGGGLEESLKRAKEIIEKHCPKDCLGINSNCGEPVAQTWPILDEELYYINESLIQWQKLIERIK